MSFNIKSNKQKPVYHPMDNAKQYTHSANTNPAPSHLSQIQEKELEQEIKDDENELLTSCYDDYKVKASDIKFFHDISEMRNEKIKYIKEQITYVDKLSSDAFTLTKNSDEKINTIFNNIDHTVHVQKESHEVIKKTVFEHEKQKDNKCCILIILMISIIGLILVGFGSNK